jgi:hypothetical protein
MPHDVPHEDFVDVPGGFGEALPELMPPKPNPPTFAGDFPHGELGDAPTFGVFDVLDGVFVIGPHPRGDIGSVLATSVVLSHGEDPKRELFCGGERRESPADESRASFASAVSGAVVTLMVASESGRPTGTRTLDRDLIAGAGVGGAADEVVSVVPRAGSGCVVSLGNGELVSAS